MWKTVSDKKYLMPIVPHFPLLLHLFSIAFITSLQASSAQKLDPTIKGGENQGDGLDLSNQSSHQSYLCLISVPALRLDAMSLLLCLYWSLRLLFGFHPLSQYAGKSRLLHFVSLERAAVNQFVLKVDSSKNIWKIKKQH